MSRKKEDRTKFFKGILEDLRAAGAKSGTIVYGGNSMKKMREELFELLKSENVVNVWPVETENRSRKNLEKKCKVSDFTYLLIVDFTGKKESRNPEVLKELLETAMVPEWPMRAALTILICSQVATPEMTYEEFKKASDEALKKFFGEAENE